MTKIVGKAQEKNENENENENKKNKKKKKKEEEEEEKKKKKDGQHWSSIRVVGGWKNGRYITGSGV
jgi:hypothetical protein